MPDLMPEEIFGYDPDEEAQYVANVRKTDPSVSLDEALQMYLRNKPTKDAVARARYGKPPKDINQMARDYADQKLGLPEQYKPSLSDPNLYAKLLAGGLGVGISAATGGLGSPLGIGLTALTGIGNAAQTNKFTDIPGVVAGDLVGAKLGSLAALRGAKNAAQGVQPSVIKQMLTGAGINLAGVGANDLANQATDAIVGNPLQSSHEWKSPTEYAIAGTMGAGGPGLMGAAKNSLIYGNNKIKNWLSAVVGEDRANDVLKAIQNRMGVANPDLQDVAKDVRTQLEPPVYNIEKKKIDAQIARNIEGTPDLSPDELNQLQATDSERYMEMLGINRAKIAKKQNVEEMKQRDLQDYRDAIARGDVGSYPSPNFKEQQKVLQAGNASLDRYISQKTLDNTNLQKGLDDLRAQTVFGGGAMMGGDVNAAGKTFLQKLDSLTKNDPKAVSSDTIAQLVPQLSTQELSFFMQKFPSYRDKIKGTLMGELINRSIDQKSQKVSLSKINDASQELGLKDPAKVAMLFPSQDEQNRFIEFTKRLGDMFGKTHGAMEGLVRAVPTAGGIYFMLRHPLGDVGAAGAMVGYTMLRTIPWDSVSKLINSPEIMDKMIALQRTANLRSITKFEAVDNWLKKHAIVQDDDLKANQNNQYQSPSILDSLKGLGLKAIDYP